MGDVVNLNRFRQAKARAQDTAKAAENRPKYGRTKGERKADTQERERLRQDLDKKKLDDPQ